MSAATVSPLQLTDIQQTKDAISSPSATAHVDSSEDLMASPRWEDYPWQRRQLNAAGLAPWQLKPLDAYTLASLHVPVLLRPFEIVEPWTKEDDFELQEKFYCFEDEWMYRGNRMTTAIAFGVCAPLLITLSLVIELDSIALIAFVLLPPFYVLIRVLAQRFIGDGYMLKTLRTLGATLEKNSADLIECEEVVANIDITTQILLTVFTNATILVGTVVDRRVLTAGIGVSFLLSYLVFLKFYHTRVGPCSRVIWRTFVYWHEFCLIYDTARIQRKMSDYVDDIMQLAGINSLFCGRCRCVHSYGRDHNGEHNPRFVTAVAERVRKRREKEKAQVDRDRRNVRSAAVMPARQQHLQADAMA